MNPIFAAGGAILAVFTFVACSHDNDLTCPPGSNKEGDHCYVTAVPLTEKEVPTTKVEPSTSTGVTEVPTTSVAPSTSVGSSTVTVPATP